MPEVREILFPNGQLMASVTLIPTGVPNQYTIWDGAGGGGGGSFPTTIVNSGSIKNNGDFVEINSKDAAVVRFYIVTGDGLVGGSPSNSTRVDGTIDNVNWINIGNFINPVAGFEYTVADAAGYQKIRIISYATYDNPTTAYVTASPMASDSIYDTITQNGGTPSHFVAIAGKDVTGGVGQFFPIPVGFGGQSILIEGVFGAQPVPTVDQYTGSLIPQEPGTANPFLGGWIIGGHTNDATPTAQILPLGPSGRSVVIEGNASGVAIPVTGTFFQTTQPISAASLPLPSGASTGAKQDTGNTSVANIDTKTPALGQAVMASSSPVVIASNQSAVPVSGPLTDTQLRATPVPVSGTVTASGPLTDTQLRASAVPVSLATLPTLAAGTNNIGDVDVLTLPALPAGTNNIGDVDVLTLPSIPAGNNNIGDVDVVTLPTLPAGNNNIGDVDIATFPANQPFNLNQVGGTAVTLTALPSGGSGQAAIPTNTNAIQMATYLAVMNRVASTALVANTLKAMMSFEHAGSSTKTVKIRSIIVSGYATTAVAGTFEVYVIRGTAASSAGTAVTPAPANPATAACECVVKTIPTIVSGGATLVGSIGDAAPAVANSTVAKSLMVYNWIDSGQQIPLTLRSGNLDTLTIWIESTAAINVTLVITVTFTEE